MLTEAIFTVEINQKKYNIQPLCNDEGCTRFKVSTDCEYMFTLGKDEYGNWQMEKDVTPFNNDIVEEIGNAIEYHEAETND